MKTKNIVTPSYSIFIFLKKLPRATRAALKSYMRLQSRGLPPPGPNDAKIENTANFSEFFKNSMTVFSLMLMAVRGQTVIGGFQLDQRELCTFDVQIKAHLVTSGGVLNYVLKPFHPQTYSIYLLHIVLTFTDADLNSSCSLGFYVTKQQYQFFPE